jgi:hypothetical protein
MFACLFAFQTRQDFRIFHIGRLPENVSEDLGKARSPHRAAACRDSPPYHFYLEIIFGG